MPRAQSHKTKPQTLQKLHNYSLRRNKDLANIENHMTIDDATSQKVTQHTIAKAHLPNNSATDKSLPNSDSNFEMDRNQQTIQQTPPTSPAKNPISFSTYLSPDKEDRPTKTDTQLDKAIRDVFSSTLIAAMTNRDAVLREIRDCITLGDEQRCKAVSRQIHTHWNQLSVNDGCILLDNRLTIPNAMKEAVIDVLHATHPGAWGMTELAHRLWWPFINRDLLNKSKTCRPCTEFGKNLKSIIPKTKWSPLKPCVEPNEEIQLDFGGPILDGQGREVYFLACIDRFSKFPTLKLYNNANATNIEHFLTKYIAIQGVPRSIRMDQARCQTGNIIKEFCNRNNIKIIFAPANDHRSIGLVERLIQTVKRRLGCIKLDPNQRPFNIKQSLRQISQELRICRKKATNISPFEAHFGRPINTPITNLTSCADSRNLKWPNIKYDYLDDNIMGNDELISDERWIQETLDSDEEVKQSKQRMLSAALNDKGEIPRTFRMTPQTSLQPLAENSKELKLARKTLAATRSKKQLQGLYEAIPEGAALVKTSGSTMTIKYPGQDDTVLHKSEVARFGTPAQPQIPLIQFAARKTVINHHGKIQRQMNVHQKDQCAKLKGEKTIRKRSNDSPTNPNLANLLKVNRTKIPPKRKFIQSPKKGKTEAKSQRTQTPPDSPFEDEDYETQAQRQDTLDNSEDPDYDPQEDLDVQEIGAAKKPTRRSKRTTKKPKKYGHSTCPQTEYDTETSEVDSPKKKFTGVANHQPPTTTQHVPQASKEDTQPAGPHAPPRKGTMKAHCHNMNRYNRWTIPCRSSRPRKRENFTPSNYKQTLKTLFFPEGKCGT